MAADLLTAFGTYFAIAAMLGLSAFLLRGDD